MEQASAADEPLLALVIRRKECHLKRRLDAWKNDRRIAVHFQVTDTSKIRRYQKTEDDVDDDDERTGGRGGSVREDMKRSIPKNRGDRSSLKWHSIAKW